MNVIYVSFPELGKPECVQDTEACIDNDLLVWYVESTSPTVRKVKIEFAYAPFFPDEKGNRFVSVTRTLIDVNNRRFAVVWGQAPAYGKDREVCKYTISGLHQDETTVQGTEYDPRIIISKPGT